MLSFVRFVCTAQRKNGSFSILSVDLWQQVSFEDVCEKLTGQCDFNLRCHLAPFGQRGAGPERREYIGIDGGHGPRGVWQHAENGGRVLQGSAAASNGFPTEHENRHQQKGDHRQVQVGRNLQ